MEKSLYKIEQQTETIYDNSVVVTKFYTLHCYLYNKNEHRNKILWSIRNLDREGVARYLLGKDNKQLGDLEFAFAVVHSKNGPAILTSEGNLMAAQVKMPIEVKNGKRTRILSKRRPSGYKSEKISKQDH